MLSWLTPADRLLLVVSMLAIGALYGLLWGPSAAGQSVEIWHNHGAIEHWPLSEDRILDIAGSEGLTRIEIKAAQVRFVSSPCTNKLCVLSGWLHQAGETAACLPNQVSLRVVGRDPRYDTINF